MKAPFEFGQERGPFGDACKLYELRVSKPVTVSELITYVLTEERGEWGHIEVNGHRLEYKYGETVSDKLTKADKKTIIRDMYGYGGWTMFEYKINAENNPFRNG